MHTPYLAARTRKVRKFGRCGVLWFALLICSKTAVPATASADVAHAEFREGEARVAAVAYRLAVANRALCEEVLAPLLGFLVRSDATHDLTVLAVASGSPAEAAGLAAGDRLRSIGGLPFRGRASVERVEEVLDQQLRDGRVVLQVVGREGARELQFTPDSGCPTSVALIPHEAVNAWADGMGIRLTTGLLSRCRNDDDLALVLGHEMAHNLLRHQQRFEGGGGSASGLLPASGAAAQELHALEEEADRFAVSLVMTAGYDLAGVAAFMDGLIDRSIIDSATHPDPDRRLALLRDAIVRAQSDPVQPRSPLS